MCPPESEIFTSDKRGSSAAGSTPALPAVEGEASSEGGGEAEPSSPPTTPLGDGTDRRLWENLSRDKSWGEGIKRPLG